MAKLPKFGDAEETGAEQGGSFQLPAFKAPVAPKLPRAPRVPVTRTPATQAPAPQAPAQQDGDFLGDVGSAIGKGFTTWWDAANNSPVVKPIISAATAIFGTLETGLSAQNGYQYAQASENNQGLITSDDIRDAAFQGRKINGQKVEIVGLENGQPVYNIQPTVTDRAEIERINQRRREVAERNATAWTRGESTIYGGDVMAEWGRDTTPGALGISEAEREGFVRDLVLDPLNVVPVNGIIKATKATSKALKGTYEASKLAARGEISNNIATLLGKNLPDASRITTAPADISADLRGLGPKATDYVEAARTKLDSKYAYRSSVLNETLNPIVKSAAVIGSGLEAGYKALASSLVRLNMDDFLKAYAKRDVTRKGATRAYVVKQDDIYRVLSGNGEELGRATSRFKAKELASQIKAGASAAGYKIKTADDVTRAVQAVEAEFAVPSKDAGSETTAAPAEAEKPGTMELYEPYEGQDGKWYVYDGKKIVRTATLEDAERYVEADLYVEAQAAAPEAVKVGKTWQVRLGNSVYEYKTKAEADAFVKAAIDNTLPEAVPAKKGLATTDSTPSPMSLADILKVPTNGAEVSALKKVLSDLDKVAKTAKGIKPTYSRQIKERIQAVLRGGDEIAAEIKVLKGINDKVVSEIDAAIKLDGTNPFALIDSVPPALVPIINKLRIVDEDGVVRSFGSIRASAKTWKAGSPSATIKASIAGELDGLKKRIAAAKYSKDGGAGLKYELIKAEFGPEIADRLTETGIYGPFKTKDEARKAVEAYNAVIDGLVAKSQQVKFSGIEDLISQTKSGGVVVDEDSLQKIFKLIDPTNTPIAKVEKAADKSSNVYFWNEIFKAEGIQTIEDIQLKLTHFGDFDNLIKASGISDDLLLAQLIKDIRNPEGGQLTEFVIRSVAKENKQAMAQRLDEADANLRSRALEGIADANAEAFAKIQQALAGQGLETLDTWGRVVVRSTAEAYDDASQAVLKRVFNQVRERKLFGVISALNRNAQLRGGKALDRQKLMDETIESMKIASDALGLLDIRITSTKFRNDEDFVTAFGKAKASKKKFDFSNEGNFAYLHMGDIMQLFKDTGANDLILDSFFPPKSTTGNKTPTNYLSVQGFSDAARQALELRSKNKAIDVDQLTARILNGGLNPDLYTKSFRDRYQDLARSLAQHLAREDVLEGLSAVHLEKSLGMAQKWIDQAQSVSDDLQKLFYEAWQANLARGDLSDEARVTLLRSHLRKVLYVSDTFRIEGGAIAESAIRAISNMMLRRGLIRTPDDIVDETTKLIDDMEMQSMRKVINTLYMYEKPQYAMRPGQTKFANEATKATVTKKLEGAEYEYEQLMGRVEEHYSSDKKVRQQFAKDRAAVQAKLDRARNAALEIGLTTRHYSGTKGWVPSEKFNYEAEVRNAQRRLLNFQAAKAGVVAREQFIADSRPVMPKFTLLTSKQKKAFLEKERIQLINTNMDLAASRIQNGEEMVAKLMDNNHLEGKGVTPDAAGEMYLQYGIAAGMVDNTNFKVEMPTPMAEPKILGGATKYGNKGRQLEEATRGQRLSESMYGAGGRRDVKGFMQRAETQSHKVSNAYAKVIRGIAVILEKTPPQVIDDAFDLIKRGEDVPGDASRELIDAYVWLERGWRPLIGSIENSIFTQRGINGDMLARAMENMGLSANNGFPSPAGLNQNEIPNFLLKMPFGQPKLPAGVAPDSQDGRAFIQAFNDNKELAGKAGASPLIAMERIMQATQNVLFQKGLAEDFVARFSYKTEGLTYNQAIDRGYVELKAIFGDDSLLKYLPEAKNGGLFPPEMAKQFFSLMREYNQMFNSKSSDLMRNDFVEGIFTVIGGVKAAQTILTPRHFFTNLVGDSLTAMVRGVVAPGHWGPSARLSTKLAIRRAGTNYFMDKQVRNNPDSMEKLFRDLTRVMDGQGGRVLEGGEPGRKTTGVVVYEGGKAVRKNLSDDDVMNLFEEWGIFEESIYQEDIQGLVDYVDTAGIGGGKASFAKRVAAKGREGLRLVTKAPGDFTAGYGNIPRGAHALKILQSRSWPSIEVAMDTIAKEIALYHPTAKSLTSAERQWGRFGTTYYTWIRMAHSMIIKMMAENYRGIAAANKLVGEWNREQMDDDGVRPANRSIGYAGDPNQMPSYLTSTAGVLRVSGQTIQDLASPLGIDVPEEVQNSMLTFVVPLATNEVLNLWKMDYDPYRDLEGELVNGLIGAGGNGMNPGLLPMLGKNISLLGEPAIAFMYNKDPATGKDLNLKTFGEVAQYVAGDQLPQLKLAQNLADPEKLPEEKFAAGFRFLFGMGFMDPNTEASKQNAVNQFNRRTADSIERIIQIEGVPPKGSALRIRLEKVAENILRQQQEENKK